MTFAEKSVIVTGATSGIGRASAVLFAREGASVLLVGRDAGELGDVERAIQDAGGRSATCTADVTAGDAPERIVSAAVGAFGAIDVVVNAAGVIATGTVENTTDEAWDAMMDVNLRAPFRLMRAAAPFLKARQGAVVNVSSVNGL